eukprot:GEMP01031129.1.p1 GENE.GEMP01031129.1~~GEMP01031129.1.p1  ORF type:complete len:304 (+),score=65.96 GEMP01031129.1:183-1094(+)
MVKLPLSPYYAGVLKVSLAAGLVSITCFALTRRRRQAHAITQRQRRRRSEDDESKETRDFDLAVQYVETNIQAIPDDLKLRLYGFYKEVTDGPFDECAPPMSFFSVNLVQRKKRAAWKAASQVDVDPRLGYIEALASFEPKWRDNTQAMSFGACLRPMTLQDDNVVLDESPIGVLCDAVAKTKVKEVTDVIREQPHLLFETDAEKMSVLHWACDRGDVTMCVLLLAQRKDSSGVETWVNAQDDKGMTALHYVVTNEHGQIVPLLLQHGADVNILDDDGDSALKLSKDTVIEGMLQDARQCCPE